MKHFLYSILLLIFFVAEITASEPYPYFASVAVTETAVRSGPGTEYYPTSQLRLGDRVAVYYETEEWCAIRPPIGSFSWISAQYVNLGTNNIGSVIADGLASRVGSENTELCDTVQVKLQKGEKVLVLDRLETPENIASPLWFKITPPSGEFRWILRSALMIPPARQTVSQKMTPKQSVIQVVYDAETEPGTTKPILPPPTRPVRLPAPPLSLDSLTDTNSSLTDTRNNDNLEKSASPPKNITNLPPLSLEQIPKLALNQSNSIQLNPNAKEFEKTESNLKESDPFQKAFEELKEETRIVLTRPTEDWVFDTLIHRGNELYEIAPTDRDLEKIYQLVETLQRTRTVRKEIASRRQFKTGGHLLSPPSSITPFPAATAIQTNNRPLNSGAPAPMNLMNPMNPMTAQPASKIATAAVKMPVKKAGDFDIVGKLGEFDPLPYGHPPYALVDEKEQIICLISLEPEVGIELKPFLGKKVGINGILGLFVKPGHPSRRLISALEVQVIQP